MKKTMKTLLAVIMLCALLCGSSANAAMIEEYSSEEGITVQPLYVDTRTTDVTLKISNGKATAYTCVDTLRKCNISITMKLQKKTGEYWLTIKTWEASKSNATSLELSKYYTVPSGTYRVQSKIVSGADTITKTSSMKTLK